ncbi:pilus assembly protein N-terminal domain-containing protein [Bradyrhizobium ottawaense]|uniref:pilus assembly protein N-terminal domain-containing protein n=1 Tax=Bradyrhizobium ottawaense TaxID=931866 RepID=UPI0030F3B88C
MKMIFAFSVALVLAGSAWAQPPREIASEDQINLVAGTGKMLVFDEPVGRIDLTQKDIVEVTPQTDRRISIAAVKAGVVQMVISAPNGNQIYATEIVVSSEPGRLVKIYGTGRNEDLNAGYTAMYCDDKGCGRPDKDLPMPTAITVERATRKIDANGSRSLPREGF